MSDCLKCAMCTGCKVCALYVGLLHECLGACVPSCHQSGTIIILKPETLILAC
uniref:Uncharacterized protein n=1 Tax=Rhizophora mucronata TaxID=61149 RepID=A0A2P2NYL2_RHIMU